MTTTLTPSTRNITRLFRTATTEQISAGADWYLDAHKIASDLAVANGVTLDVAAGVIAAVSPLNSWGANINLAGRILASQGKHSGGYLAVGVDKANAIINGAPILATLRGEKISNFFLSITTQGREGVTIDRHAWSLAVNFRYPDASLPTLKGKRYALAVDAYKRASKILSRELEADLTPAQVQAVTWVLWRNKFWAEGAWD